MKLSYKILNNFRAWTLVSKQDSLTSLSCLTGMQLLSADVSIAVILIS